MARTARGEVDKLKHQVLGLLGDGLTVEQAMSQVGRTQKTYENWRAADKTFAGKVDELRVQLASAKRRGVDAVDRSMSFAEFRKKYLGQDTYAHQQAWVDLLEGREPDLRPGEEITWGDPNRLIVNVPPFHAKSHTITIEYCTYRICMNPNVRIIIVSKRQDQANKFLYAIKQRLTSRQWGALQAAFAPPGGFKPDRGDGQWGANRFYVSSDDREEKDPTVEALGLGSQIYGSRADLIILDDCVVLSNAHEFEKQITWLQSEVESRVKNGKILLIGTRLSPADLYSELRNGDRYLSGESPWTYLRQPAVLEYADKAADWKTLWPESSSPLETGQEQKPNGLYAAWDGPALERERNRRSPKTWALVYMQQEVSDDAVFNTTSVMGSVDKRRVAGRLQAGAMGHPRNGMEGMYVIASMDPAMSGDTFSLVMAVDRVTRMRHIMNAWVKTSPTPQYIRDHIQTVTEEYGVHEWVIEQNAFQLFLTQDEGIQEYLRNRGVRMTGHYTSRNKIDPDFGVASIAPLFGSLRTDENQRQHHNADNLISLPDPRRCEGVQKLIEQLVSWQPGKLGRQLKQDGPMALWFGELRAREVLGVGQRRTTHFLENRYLTKSDLRKRLVVPADARYQFLGEPA